VRWRSAGVQLTPIGSPAREAEKTRLDQDRPHTNSFSFGDPLRPQERPNSAPERVLGPLSPAQVQNESEEVPAMRLVPRKAKPHPLSPEQGTFHPEPRRHQPSITPMLESEASP
ncbi:unnamed protein product, partial [Effrenium voratum]